MKVNPNRRKIIEAYMVPEGDVSPEIFKLPCVSGATKLRDGNTEYTVVIGYLPGLEIADYTDYICKSEDGKWFVLEEDTYHEYMSNN